MDYLLKNPTDIENKVSFRELSIAVEESERLEQQLSTEGPDAKVLEFLRILEDYRVKCEEEGNYLEAGRAHKQLAVLRKQEEKRQHKAILVRAPTLILFLPYIIHTCTNSSRHVMYCRLDTYQSDRTCSWRTTCSSPSSMRRGTSTWRSTTRWRSSTSSR